MAYVTRPVPDLLNDVVGKVQDIVGAEVRLAAAEVSENLAVTARQGALIGAGIVLGVMGVGFLLLTCVYALEIVLAPWLAALIVGFVTTLIAGSVAAAGFQRLRHFNMKPEKTIVSIKENAQWLKHQAK